MNESSFEVKQSKESRKRMEHFGVSVTYYPCYLRRTPNMHSVDTLLISFIVKGNGKHIIGDSVFPESGGSIGITSYGVQHSIVTDAKGLEKYNIFIDPQNHSLPVLPASLNDTLHLLFPQHQGFRNQLNRTIHLSIPDPEPLAAIVKLMDEEIRADRPGAEGVVTDCLRIFLVHCCRAAMENGIHPSHSADTPTWVTQIMSFMNDSFTQNLTLKDLADRVGLSPGYLCQAFKRHTGKTLFEYLIERRIQAAMLRLRTTNDKVIGIAMDCGFNDLTYFNRTFKKITGFSPTAWRKKTRSHPNGSIGKHTDAQND